MKIRVLKEHVIHSKKNRKETRVVLEAEVLKTDFRECVELVPSGKYRAEGVALCNDSDKWDSCIGYRIARSRAYKQLYRDVLDDALVLKKNLKQNLAITESSIEKYLNALKEQDKDINRIIESL